MIYDFEKHVPRVAPTAWVAPNATVIGRVSLAEDTSIWWGAVLRGDVEAISLGARSNIQDNSVVHVTTDRYRTTVGADVTVGHGAILHGCTIGDRVLVGMGAIVMDDVVIEDDCIVAAGALVTPGTRIRTGHLAVGSPARPARPLRAGERAEFEESSRRYVSLSRRYLAMRVASPPR